MTRIRFVAVALLGLTIRTAPAAAQSSLPDGGPDPATVRVRIGPLWMNPVLSLSNLGIDQNVFNVPADKNPSKDFTATVAPNTDLWLRLGRTWLTGSLKEEIVWYQKYASERSANNAYSIAWKMPFNRVILSTNAGYISSRERPGFEIDLRAHRTEVNYVGALEIRALANTFVGIRASSVKVKFDQATVFQGSDLHDELNRTTTTTGLSLRNQLTPLTSLSLSATRVQDRFQFNPLRDSNSTALLATLTLDPFALVKGNLTVGYRDFEPLSHDVPNFIGTTVSSDLSYAIFETTRFTLHAVRDVQYSYDINQPYYVLSGIDGSVAQQIFGPFDLIARLGAERMAYRDRVGADVQITDRTDRVRSYGAGIGYHMGKDLRLGLNIDKSIRSSELLARRYDDVKIGTAITYGF